MPLLRTVLFAALCVPAGKLCVSRLARRLPGPAPGLPRDRAPHAAAAGFLAEVRLASVMATGNLAPTLLGQIDLGGLCRLRLGRIPRPAGRIPRPSGRVRARARRSVRPRGGGHGVESADGSAGAIRWS
ncbi:hypothetical protein [Streptomyces sp. V3I7]|uniref:hypothetical protein n=1 Tax=Streptomyces sp. V3I7 TaxID=3042278 RepID=UPI002780A8A0|nr:hypothetical protein [Streptomyces sp. V3I7]MDQ0990137.1 hypothetical protein [Streptomyces sp. V3I7]